jgi:hypothetical protein
MEEIPTNRLASAVMTKSLLRPMAGPTSRPATLFRGKIYWRWVISTCGRFGVGPVYMRRRIWTNVDTRRTIKARISTDVDFRRPILMSTIGRRVTRVRLYTRPRVRPYLTFVEDVCSGSIYSKEAYIRTFQTVQEAYMLRKHILRKHICSGSIYSNVSNRLT